MSHIGIFVGDHEATNVRLTLENICWMVQSEHEISIFSCYDNVISDNLKRYSDIYISDKNGRFGEIGILNQYIRKGAVNPDVLFQIIDPTRHGLFVGIASKTQSIPFVYRYPSDSFDAYRAYGGLRKLAYFGLHNIIGKIPLQFAKKHIVLGPRGHQKLSKLGIDKQNISILPPPINKNRFESLSKKSPSNQPFNVLYLGGDSYIKGFDRMEDIIDLTDSLDIEINFLIGGSMSSSPTIGGRENVSIIGFISPEEIPNYLSIADVLCIPSRREGLPRVLLEALASGTPVIATGVGEIPHITDNIFKNYSELEEYLLNIRNLPVDDVELYYRHNLKHKYIEFFNQF